MVDAGNAWEMLTAPQRKALGLAGDAFDSVIKAGRAGISQPEETLSRVTTLIAAVGDIAASSTRPMEALLASQRNFANALTSFAQLQMEMAEVVERMAHSHSMMVDAMEALASPALMVSEVLRSEQPEPESKKRGRPAKKTSPKKASTSKTSASSRKK